MTAIRKSKLKQAVADNSDHPNLWIPDSAAPTRNDGKMSVRVWTNFKIGRLYLGVDRAATLDSLLSEAVLQI